ncbi:MAG: hypothetical protein PHI85_07120 [Victivallaceae bacterium]|nr:hypothetical protein [Victivallaceae bacterium]
MKMWLKILMLAAIPPALVWLAALAGGIGFQPFPDAADYLALGGNLLTGFERNTAVPPGWRTPGYPALLWCFSFAGAKAYLWVNTIALYLIAVLLLRRAAEWRLRCGLLILLLAFSCGTTALAASALSETVFVLFLLLNLDLLRRREYELSGMMLGVAVLIRPAAVLLWVLELGFMAAVYRPDWRRLALFALTANLLVVGWCVRNYVVFDHFAYTSHSGRYWYYYKVGSAISIRTGEDFETVRSRLSAELPAEADEFAVDQAASRAAVKWISDNRGDFLTASAADLPNFWMPDVTGLLERVGLSAGNRGTLSVLRRSGLSAAFRHYFAGAPAVLSVAAALGCAVYGVILLLVAGGVLRLLLARHWAVLCAVVLLTGYFWLLPAGNLDWRFRMVVWPVLLLCAVYATGRRHNAAATALRGGESRNVRQDGAAPEN